MKQCDGMHGEFPHNTRCTLYADHEGPHKNASYTWERTALELEQIKRDKEK